MISKQIPEMTFDQNLKNVGGFFHQLKYKENSPCYGNDNFESSEGDSFATHGSIGSQCCLG